MAGVGAVLAGLDFDLSWLRLDFFSNAYVQQAMLKFGLDGVMVGILR